MPDEPRLGGAVVWVAVTDKIGHVNQCLAFAAALDIEPSRVDRIRGFDLGDARRIKIVRRLQGIAQSLSLLRRLPGRPLVLVISGRSSEYAAKFLRWRLGKRLFVISVGPPINFPQVVDLSIMNEASLPKWERRREKFGDWVALEVLPICGAMARRSGRRVPPERREKGLVAVLVGGENKHFALDGEAFGTAMKRLRDMAMEGSAEVEVVLSRRTSARTEEIVRNALSDAPVTVHGRERSGAYWALLDRAEMFIVTPDSVTMLSEVCLTGRPVFALDLESLPGSDGGGERLVEAMVARGVVRTFVGEVVPFSPPQRLDEAARIAPLAAARIREWSGAASAADRPPGSGPH